MPSVNYMRKELKEAKLRYDIVRDCLGGEMAVKKKSTEYLPMPNATDASAENSARYQAYKLRASFYSVTKRTLEGLCGQIYTSDPIIKVPDELKKVVSDADGSGVDLVQLSKAGVELTLGYGRAGLFIDYPATVGPATREQIEKGDIRPTITFIEPWRVINWRTKTRGARQILSLVVIEETYIESDDGFEAVEKTQWRVLRLDDADNYRVEIWRQEAVGNFGPVQSFSPADATGQPLREIPFTFVGAKNNDHQVDEVPMYDIASLNLAHYRNSADYEESVFLVGQPTPVFSGLSEDWVKNILKGKVQLGSRAAVSLPTGGNAMLLQANENSLAFEAMQHKEKQMVALGARLVEQRGVIRTASEANIDYTTESSVLTSSAKNVSAAITFALQWAMKFISPSADTAEISFTLNTDFAIARMSSEDRRQLIEEWHSKAISFSELRTNLRKNGIAHVDDEQAIKDIKKYESLLPKEKPTKPNSGVDSPKS